MENHPAHISVAITGEASPPRLDGIGRADQFAHAALDHARGDRLPNGVVDDGARMRHFHHAAGERTGHAIRCFGWLRPNA